MDEQFKVNLTHPHPIISGLRKIADILERLPDPNAALVSGGIHMLTIPSNTSSFTHVEVNSDLVLKLPDPSKVPSKRNDDEIVKACERHFQNGGTKVCFVRMGGRYKNIELRSTDLSGKAAVAAAFDDEWVFQRRKQRDGTYRFTKLKEGR